MLVCEFLQDDKDGQWDCDFCHKKKLVETRNCEGKYKPFPVKVFDEVHTSCPVSTLSGDWMDVVGLVNMSESSGMGGGGFIPPSLLLEETNIFFHYRNIILGEKNRIEKFKDKNKKDK